ncbi:membrane protein [Aquimarina atlantica]|uniref:Membrane protein n=1 Tax=Aquimarina atlantica TaxID=1317122 RepID=A0A023BRI1_9FLAO|nr:hypothetical protein [Aquimarina atlantica]EZH72600.1 membrane protein [Aquimarina atlantica]
MENSKIFIGYIIYLPIVITLTYFVSRTLFKNGKTFMIDIFRDRKDIALATNRLFEVGFYLLNIGWALLILKIDSYDFQNTYQNLIEILSFKVGGFSMYLGTMLFLNLLLFFRGRKKASRKLSSTLKTVQTQDPHAQS